MFGLSAFLLAISAASGLLPANVRFPKIFYNPKTVDSIFRQSSYNDCSICDVTGCFAMGDARCQYYREVDGILHKEDQDTTDYNPELRAEVDALLLDLTLQESILTRECVPYISHYTNCNKDNICLGCTACDCDARGKWNCSKTQQCRADFMLNVDHRVLVQVMENLRNFKAERRVKRKRSTDNTVLSENSGIEEKLTSQEITSLINGASSSKSKVKKYDEETKILDTESDKVTEKNMYIKSSTTDKNESLNDSGLDFDDFYLARYNESNGNNYQLHLPMLKNHTEDILDPDYMDIPEENVTQSNDTKKSVENTFGKQDDFFADTQENSRSEGTNLIFYTNRNKKELNDLDINTKEDGNPNDGDTNDIYEPKSVRVVKREILNVPERETLVNISKHSIRELKVNLYNPLSFIINNKRNEINELERMREHLMNYIKTYANNETFFNLNHSVWENATKSLFTVYKLEFTPNLKNESIKKNAVLEEHVSKLKNDIYEVMRDIVEIQKITHFKRLPDDINVLIRAMKYYVHNQGKLHIETEFRKITESKEKNYRKSFTLNHNKIILNPATDTVQQMLYVLDKDMPQSNALAALSNRAKTILKRIIKQYYHNKFSSTGIKAYDSQYNIRKDLEDIGIKWYRLTRNIASSPLPDRLVNMKLLHLELSRNICKLDDALGLIDFAQSGRASTIYEHLTEQFVSRIGEDIKNIYNKVQQIIKLQNVKMKRNTGTISDTTKEPNNKKDSFLQHMKHLLNQSKNDIRDIFKNKAKSLNKQRSPNHMHKNRTPYKESAMKWQNINVTSIRNRRSPVEFQKRIKNIIPNYLKGKLSMAKNYKSNYHNLKPGK